MAKKAEEKVALYSVFTVLVRYITRFWCENSSVFGTPTLTLYSWFQPTVLWHEYRVHWALDLSYQTRGEGNFRQILGRLSLSCSFWVCVHFLPIIIINANYPKAIAVPTANMERKKFASKLWPILLSLKTGGSTVNKQSDILENRTLRGFIDLSCITRIRRIEDRSKYGEIKRFVTGDEIYHKYEANNLSFIRPKTSFHFISFISRAKHRWYMFNTGHIS